MDAKTRAEFIHSVAAGKNIPCPACGAVNESGSKFCIICGSKIPVNESLAESLNVADEGLADPVKNVSPLAETAAEENKILCSECGSMNEAGFDFCVNCGSKLSVGEDLTIPLDVADEASAIAPEPVLPVSEDQTMEGHQEQPLSLSKETGSVDLRTEHGIVEEIIIPEEPDLAFAEGLPEWDLLPPQQIVRKRGIL